MKVVTLSAPVWTNLILTTLPVEPVTASLKSGVLDTSATLVKVISLKLGRVASRLAM